jgi:hypothetical protein
MNLEHTPVQHYLYNLLSSFTVNSAMSKELEVVLKQLGYEKCPQYKLQQTKQLIGL